MHADEGEVTGDAREGDESKSVAVADKYKVEDDDPPADLPSATDGVVDVEQGNANNFGVAAGAFEEMGDDQDGLQRFNSVFLSVVIPRIEPGMLQDPRWLLVPDVFAFLFSGLAIQSLDFFETLRTLKMRTLPYLDVKACVKRSLDSGGTFGWPCCTIL